jgi:autotransporter-associated beta strand protein
MRRWFLGMVWCSAALAVIFIPSTVFAIDPYWSPATLTSGYSVAGVQLTSDGSGLMVAVNQGNHTAWLTDLNPQTGAAISPWPKTVSISGTDLCRMVLDNSGNIILGDGGSGYHVYKYDPTLTTQAAPWPYYESANSFEDVQGLITDSAGNVYASGDCRNSSALGGWIAKLPPSGPPASWSVYKKSVPGGDRYNWAMALSPDQQVVYCGGAQDGYDPNNGVAKVYFHKSDSTDGYLPIPITTAGSAVNGLATDSSGNVFVAYLDHLNSSAYGLPGIAKVNSNGAVLWQNSNLNLGVTGRFANNALAKRSDDCYFLAFNQGSSASTAYAGLAKFNADGRLLGMDTINLQGYQTSNGGIAIGNDGKVYLGLQSYGTGAQTCKAVALNPVSTWNGGGAPDHNWTNYHNWSGWAPATGEPLQFGYAADTTNNNGDIPNKSYSGITFTSEATNPYDLAGNAISLSGPITNNATSTIHTISLSICSGSVVKNGEGTVVLAGSNTYTGGTTINAGTLRIDSDSALGAVPASPSTNITLANGTTLQAGASLVLNANRNIGISGTVNIDTNGYDMSIPGVIGGFVDLSKDGEGVLTLSGANTFPGATRIYKGILRLGNSNALANCTLDYDYDGTLSFGSLTAATLGALRGSKGLTLTNDSGQNVALTLEGGDTYSGNLSGGGSLIKAGPGTATLKGAVNVSGGTTVNTGTLQFESNIVSFGAQSVQAKSGATVAYKNATINGGYLLGPGTHTTLGGSTNTFNAVTIYNGTPFSQYGTTNFNSVSSGGQLTNNTVSVLNWTGGYNVFTGVITVNGTLNVSNWGNQGVIVVNGGGIINNTAGDLTCGGGSRTTVNAGGLINVGTALDLNGALLVNNGTISGTTNVYYGSLAKGAGTYGLVNVNDGGKFSPGNSPGSVTTGAATFNSGGQYLVEIGDAASGAGTGWDLWNVNGSLSISAGTTANSQFVIGVASVNGSIPGPAGNFVNTHRYDWQIASASAGVSGFNPADIAIDSSAFANAMGFGRFGVSQSGNSLYLTFLPSMAGDATVDGTVDINDLSVVLANYNKTGLTWAQGDFNGDNTVDISDLSNILANYNKSVGYAAAHFTAVPEPGALALLAAGAVGLLACASRKQPAK